MQQMDASRDGAINQARHIFDSGLFVDRLAQMVEVPTESHPPLHQADLYRYCHEVIAPMIGEMGFSSKIYDNSRKEHGPFLIGTRIEDPALPTLLIYGHGDVVRAMPERWREGLDPYKLTVEADKIYGRGTVDNKGQHLIAILALKAVLSERGRLGFNTKIFIETGEEAGSPGISEFINTHRDECAADVFIALDGPRQSRAVPDIQLGTRGGIAMDLIVDLREGSHHSGHWGGLLADPAIVLAHALSSIVSRDGRILVEGWRPANVPESVKAASRAVVSEILPGAPVPDDYWGEPGLTNAERIYAWNSAIVLAMVSGQPESPVNAVAGFARSRLQLRHTVDTDPATVIPALKSHLVEKGFPEVKVEAVVERDWFPPSRTDPDHPWVQFVAASMQKTIGRKPNIVPTVGASGPSEFFKSVLDVPIMWIPNSYGGCGQHGPNEHGLGSQFREGLELMAGVFWDSGELDAPRRKTSSAAENLSV
ncbi:M20/M25/M40 family metallo-hydrolase [Mesorhizobium sp. DCY119]|uniref:M20/M25/M40 family metallo-hydrolase n=2 Tax=Mesorhizobium sp. DCY119 TaxID=2108445 RepID=UPI001FE11328|nr:M20/M25/M40 family metallo-hydrolase [Mesorhizobium sp. DCY119]